MSEAELPKNTPTKAPEQIPEATDFVKERTDFNKDLLKKAPKTLTDKNIISRNTLSFSQKIDSDKNMISVLREQLTRQGLSKNPEKDALAIAASVGRELGPLFQNRFTTILKAGSTLECRNGILGLTDEKGHWTGTDLSVMFDTPIDESLVIGAKAKEETKAEANPTETHEGAITMAPTKIKVEYNEVNLKDYNQRKKSIEEMNAKVNIFINTIKGENTGYVILEDAKHLPENPDKDHFDVAMEQLEAVELLVNAKCDTVYSKMYWKTREYVQLRSKEFIDERREINNKKNKSLVKLKPNQDYEAEAKLIEKDMPNRFLLAINSLLRRTNKITLGGFPVTLTSKVQLKEKYSCLLQIKETMLMAGQSLEALKGYFNEDEMRILDKDMVGGK